MVEGRHQGVEDTRSVKDFQRKLVRNALDWEEPGDEADDDQGVDSLLVEDLVQLGRMESVKSILY